MPRSRDSVRQANFASSALADTPHGNCLQGDIQFSDIRTSEFTEIYLEEKSEYPFPEQLITQGTYKYDHEGELGRESADGTFELRHESDLFILKKVRGSASIENTISSLTPALNNVFAAEIAIHDSYRPTRRGIWTFIDGARSVHELILLYDTGEELSLFELEDETGKNYEELFASYPVIFSNMVFQLPWGDSVNVIYDQGHLEISSDDDDIYEHVVQRFERDVVANR